MPVGQAVDIRQENLDGLWITKEDWYALSCELISSQTVLSQIPVSRCCGEDFIFQNLVQPILSFEGGEPFGRRTNISTVEPWNLIRYCMSIRYQRISVFGTLSGRKAKGYGTWWYFGICTDSDLTDECWMLDKPDMHMFICRTFISHILSLI